MNILSVSLPFASSLTTVTRGGRFTLALPLLCQPNSFRDLQRKEQKQKQKKKQIKQNHTRHVRDVAQELLYNRWFTDSNGLKIFSKPQKLNVRAQPHYEVWIKDRDSIKPYKILHRFSLRHYQAHWTAADKAMDKRWICKAAINNLSVLQHAHRAVFLYSTHCHDHLEQFRFNFTLTVSFPWITCIFWIIASTLTTLKGIALTMGSWVYFLLLRLIFFFLQQ